MSENQAKITIIIPMYNVEKFIRQCLDSLLNQTVTDFKVIIVDDGSKDGSAQIAKQYASEYPQTISYIYQENAGLGAARNAGIRLVATEYIMFLDSDDWLIPRTIEHICAALELESEAPDIIFMEPIVYNMATGKHENWSDNERLKGIFSTCHVTAPRETPEMYALEASVCRSAWRRDFLEQHDFAFPEGTKWEDVFPHFYLYYWARRCIYVKNAGFFYRINSGNQITSLSGKARLDITKVFASTLLYALENQWRDVEIVYIIHMMMLFVRWAIDVSKPDVLKELVPQLRTLCKAVPAKYVKMYRKQYADQKDMQLILRLLRMPVLNKLFSNYHTIEFGKNAHFHFRKMRGH